MTKEVSQTSSFDELTKFLVFSFDASDHKVVEDILVKREKGLLDELEKVKICCQNLEQERDDMHTIMKLDMELSKEIYEKEFKKDRELLENNLRVELELEKEKFEKELEQEKDVLTKNLRMEFELSKKKYEKELEIEKDVFEKNVRMELELELELESKENHEKLLKGKQDLLEAKLSLVERGNFQLVKELRMDFEKTIVVFENKLSLAAMEKMKLEELRKDLEKKAEVFENMLSLAVKEKMELKENIEMLERMLSSAAIEKSKFEVLEKEKYEKELEQERDRMQKNLKKELELCKENYGKELKQEKELMENNMKMEFEESMLVFESKLSLAEKEKIELEKELRREFEKIVEVFENKLSLAAKEKMELKENIEMLERMLSSAAIEKSELEVLEKEKYKKELEQERDRMQKNLKKKLELCKESYGKELKQEKDLMENNMKMEFEESMLVFESKLSLAAKEKIELEKELRREFEKKIEVFEIRLALADREKMEVEEELRKEVEKKVEVFDIKVSLDDKEKSELEEEFRKDLEKQAEVFENKLSLAVKEKMELKENIEMLERMLFLATIEKAELEVLEKDKYDKELEQERDRMQKNLKMELELCKKNYGKELKQEKDLMENNMKMELELAKGNYDKVLEREQENMKKNMGVEIELCIENYKKEIKKYRDLLENNFRMELKISRKNYKKELKREKDLVERSNFERVKDLIILFEERMLVFESKLSLAATEKIELEEVLRREFQKKIEVFEILLASADMEEMEGEEELRKEVEKKVEVLKCKNQVLEKKIQFCNDSLGKKFGVSGNKLSLATIEKMELEYKIAVLERKLSLATIEKSEIEKELRREFEDKIEMKSELERGLRREFKLKIEVLEERNRDLEKERRFCKDSLGKKLAVAEKQLARLKAGSPNVMSGHAQANRGSGNDSGGGVIVTHMSDSHNKASDLKSFRTKTNSDSLGNPSSTPQRDNRDLEGKTNGYRENSINCKSKRSIDGSEDDSGSLVVYKKTKRLPESGCKGFSLPIDSSKNLKARSPGTCKTNPPPKFSSASIEKQQDKNGRHETESSGGKETRWETSADMLFTLRNDQELCMGAVCALYRRHISAGKSTDDIGFRSLDVPSGTEAAKYLINDDPRNKLSRSASEVQQDRPSILETCWELATKYLKQLFVMYQKKLDPFFCQCEDA